MKFEIRNRWTAAVIFECEADSLRIAVEMAVEKKISLRDADLRDADLSDANLRDADLRAANLRDADLSDANLRDADLSDANLRDADLSDADLRDANLRDADLSAADLSDANLRDADLSAANLRDAKEDFFKVLDLVPKEVPGLYMALLDGRVDGSQYQGECACLVGTIANVRGENYQTLGDLQPNADRPAERFFLGIRKGDNPDNSAVSNVAAGWVREFCKAKDIRLPVREVIWK